MKQICLILGFSFVTAFCFGQTQQKGCSAFRNGKFAYRDSADHIINVTRKANTQSEHDTRSGVTTRFRIKWISDCEYELIQTRSSSEERSKYNKSVTKISITKTNGNDSYEYDCGCKYREGKTNIGLMVRLED